MIWTSNSDTCDHSRLGELVPDRVLVEYEGPRIYTTRDCSGNLLFAYQCDLDQALWRYIVVPCTENRLEQFIAGQISIVQMLALPFGWIVDMNVDGEIVSAWEVNPESLPSEYRPLPNVYLTHTAETGISVQNQGFSFHEKSTAYSN